MYVHRQQSCGDKWTKRPKTILMVYMNMSSINWYSKKQSTIETSVLGPEFVAMKVRVETVHAIQYKWRMMGIPISGPSYIYGDNIWVSIILKKKCNVIAYHTILKFVAMRESLTEHIRSEDNPASFLTKVVT